MTATLAEILPDDVETLARHLLNRACDRDLRLATAESCTGGLLASVLTDVEGCSHAYESGFVTYTDDAKHELLSVPRKLLEAKGAVSQEVAVAMAEGALSKTHADLVLSVTGFAGAGAEPGLVHFALAQKHGPTRHEEHRFGDIGRGPIRIECLRTALRMMRESL